MPTPVLALQPRLFTSICNPGLQQQQALRTVYEGIGWEVPRLLEMMPMASDWYFDTAAQIDMPRWSQGRVVLVGDAAYCASPMSGQGTSIALIGAYVLAGELAAASGAHLHAFAEFENVMRPFVEANQALGLKSAMLMSSGKRQSVGGWLLKQLMRIVPGPHDAVDYQSLHRADHPGG
jgi:2-polyprenyl-6-methoxyphenol hydroxylase-like FAD-dependent oxidoreductase